MTTDEARHLQRRLAFASTPLVASGGMSVDAAFNRLFSDSQRAGLPAPPDAVRTTWTNTALRTPGMSDPQYDTLRAEQLAAHRRDIDVIRLWWLREMVAGAAPLRENLTLFFEATFGGSTELVDIPHAIHGRNALIRRLCLGTIPALLDSLVTDPAMLIQIGMDEHFKARVSDRPAKLILDHWTVGAGAYADTDVENLSRALTGWRLEAAPGQRLTTMPDPAAARPARRTGLHATFVAEQADARNKTILGTTANFDARSAMRLLARHPATARRFSERLVRHLGVDGPSDRLVGEMAAVYQSTGGSVEAMLRAIVASKEFWSEPSRWSLIKSPVHLAVGACHQLDLVSPPLVEMNRWLVATGQTLFDTPNNGEGGWPGQEAWVTPPDRLSVRYQLPVVLSGRMPALGIRAARTEASASIELPLGRSLANANAKTLVERLDPAPGLDLSSISRLRSANAASDQSELIRQVMMTPQYQLA